MGYFGYIAQQAFKTAPDGRRLFYRGGPWSRPFIVPDAETEQRLFKKQLWLMRLLLGALIIGQPFLFILVPEVNSKPLWFFGFMAIILIVFRIAGSIVFRAELTKLSRADSRLSMHAFCSSTAATQSTGAVLLILLAAVAFVAGGYWMVASGRNAFVGWMSIVFFGLCGLAWAYMLSLKLKRQ